MPIVGTNISRLDGIDKVTGKALYVDDIEMPGMWHGAVVRSSIPHGRLRGIEKDPSFDWSKVVIADASDILGKNCVAMIGEDLPLIVDSVTKHVGEAVLLIAAPTRELALEAVSRVKVSFDEMKPIFSIEDSDKIIAQYEITKGDVDKAFEKADVIVEGTYRMGHQEHIYIETQGMIASIDNEKLKVMGSMQCPYYISRALSILMDMPEESISVRQTVVGGAFGGKEDYPSVLAGYAAVLAKKCNRPVKIVYDRSEDTLATTKRHPAIVHHRTGVKKDGTLVAMDILYKLDAGAYVTLTPVVLSRGIIHSPGPYRCKNVRSRAYAYETNTPPNGAFRGFGAPQAFFPLEVHMDRIAEDLGISPLKLRQKNCLRDGDETATGQLLKGSVGSEEVLKEATKRSDFENRFKKYANASKGSRIRRGIGMSFFMHGAGFTGSGEAILKGKAGLRLDADGKICVLTACTEMGQGAHTVIPQMVADHLGIDLSCISIETPDTAIVPNSGPTVASRTTMIMGVVLGKCAAKLRSELINFASEKYRAHASALSLQGEHLKKDGNNIAKISDLVKSYLSERGPLTIIDHYELPPDIKWDEKTYRGDAYPTYSWGCDVAEVEVDMDTFEVRVIKMWLAQDIGRAVNPKLAQGQIEGGTLQALGYAIMEKHALDKGRFLSDRLQTYIIPTAMDAPEMDTVIVEKAYEHGPMGAKGVGELPMDGGAPAIANAVANATGIRINELPITPEKLFEQWRYERS
ncbi:MAG: xanthine dehydrogenase family protein molybdopterin-binding subunit [Pseudomonadota bacterium]